MLGCARWFLRWSGFGGFHARQENKTDLNGCIGLAVPTEAAIVLPPPKMLHIVFGGRMLHDLAQHPGPSDEGLANQGFGVFLIKQNAIEFHIGADLRLTEIHLNHIPFLDAILPGAILKNRVHAHFLKLNRPSSRLFYGAAGFCAKAEQRRFY